MGSCDEGGSTDFHGFYKIDFKISFENNSIRSKTNTVTPNPSGFIKIYFDRNHFKTIRPTLHPLLRSNSSDHFKNNLIQSKANKIPNRSTTDPNPSDHRSSKSMHRPIPTNSSPILQDQLHNSIRLKTK